MRAAAPSLRFWDESETKSTHLEEVALKKSTSEHRKPVWKKTKGERKMFRAFYLSAWHARDGSRRAKARCCGRRSRFVSFSQRENVKTQKPQYAR